jgi:hypothetical protein
MMFIFALLLLACGDGDTPNPPTGTTVKTPMGATVLRLSGPALDAETAAAIDAQISRVMEVAKQVNPAYNFPGHDRYVIELVAPSNDCETPGAFRVAGGQYGTSICVAGQYFPSNDRIRTTTEAIRTMNAVHYEGEHYGLKIVDRPMYERTLTHTAENPHPILGRE